MSIAYRHALIACALIALGVISVQALVLYWFGQPLICDCGYIKLWEGVVLSPGNSQHVSDWYTFSHVIHGVLFYAILTLVFPKMPIVYRFFIALSLESAWEVVENTPAVIEMYRQQALAQGYTGDSILNSVSDSLAMVGGFFMARRLPIIVTIALVLAMEIGVLYMIRDNLALNILNFLMPLEAVSTWQSQL